MMYLALSLTIESAFQSSLSSIIFLFPGFLCHALGFLLASYSPHCSSLAFPYSVTLFCPPFSPVPFFCVHPVSFPPSFILMHPPSLFLSLPSSSPSPSLSPLLHHGIRIPIFSFFRHLWDRLSVLTEFGLKGNLLLLSISLSLVLFHLSLSRMFFLSMFLLIFLLLLPPNPHRLPISFKVSRWMTLAIRDSQPRTSAGSNIRSSNCSSSHSRFSNVFGRKKLLFRERERKREGFCEGK